MSKVLVATQKPFSPSAAQHIQNILTKAGHEIEFLEHYGSELDLNKAIVDIDAIIIRSDIVDSSLLNEAKQLKVIVRAGAGYDNVDLAAATKRNVVVMNTPGQNSNAVAELVIGLLIYGFRNFFQPGTGREIHGKKLGLQAFGNVGKLVAKQAQALGMYVYAYDPFVDEKILNEMKVNPVKTLSQLYSQCDVVSLHIPALPKTIGSIDYKLCSKLPPDGILINTARKEIINESDLEMLLRNRPDLRYLCDVKPDNYDLLVANFPAQIFATPKKMGAETEEANSKAATAAAQLVADFLATGDAPFKVN